MLTAGPHTITPFTMKHREQALRSQAQMEAMYESFVYETEDTGDEEESALFCYIPGEGMDVDEGQWQDLDF